MKIRLISYTKPHTDTFTEDYRDLSKLIDSPADLVAFCARVSNPQNQMNKETSEKLLGYLLRNKHWSPFQMVDITLEIESTRDIIRQILRHRSFEFQEFSQRYADPTSMDFEIREARLQDTKNRQNSIETDDKKLQDAWNVQQEIVQIQAINTYKWALENGIAKEVARSVLPEGMTTSRIYMKGSLRSWIHYIELRSDNGTQKEHREIAIECANVISAIFPMIKDFVFNN
jgi:thymidylate synthase (FAD)